MLVWWALNRIGRIRSLGVRALSLVLLVGPFVTVSVLTNIMRPTVWWSLLAFVIAVGLTALVVELLAGLLGQARPFV